MNPFARKPNRVFSTCVEVGRRASRSAPIVFSTRVEVSRPTKQIFGTSGQVFSTRVEVCRQADGQRADVFSTRVEVSRTFLEIVINDLVFSTCVEVCLLLFEHVK